MFWNDRSIGWSIKCQKKKRSSLIPKTEGDAFKCLVCFIFTFEKLEPENLGIISLKN